MYFLLPHFHFFSYSFFSPSPRHPVPTYPALSFIIPSLPPFSPSILLIIPLSSFLCLLFSSSTPLCVSFSLRLPLPPPVSVHPLYPSRSSRRSLPPPSFHPYFLPPIYCLCLARRKPRKCREKEDYHDQGKDRISICLRVYSPAASLISSHLVFAARIEPSLTTTLPCVQRCLAPHHAHAPSPSSSLSPALSLLSQPV